MMYSDSGSSNYDSGTDSNSSNNDEEEFLRFILLRRHKINMFGPKRPNKWKGIDISGHFDIENLPQPCVDLFRFTKTEISELASYLLPIRIQTPKRYRVDRIEAFCIVLRRFAYPNRWSDLVSLFRRPVSALSGL